MLAATTSAPSVASAFALSDLTSRVIARTRKELFLSARIARANPPPCAPVAPTTEMIFLSAIIGFLVFASGIRDESAAKAPVSVLFCHQNKHGDTPAHAGAVNQPRSRAASCGLAGW